MLWRLKLSNGWLDFDGSKKFLVGENTQQGHRGIILFSLEYQQGQKALGISLADLFKADDIFKTANTYDKTLMEKLKLIDELDSTEKKSLYNIIDSLIAKKRLKDNLQSLVKG